MRALRSKELPSWQPSLEGDWSYAWHVEFLHYYPERRNEMADSLADAAGAATTWTGPDGKVYKIKPMTIGDMAAMERWQQSDKIRTFLEATKDVDRETRQGALVELCNTGSDTDGLAKSMTSMSGLCFLLWRQLHKSHPDVTLEYVGELITPENMDEVNAIIQTTGGQPDADPTMAETPSP